jgi:hypothetical protein
VKRLAAAALILVACSGLALAAPRTKATTGPKRAMPADGIALGLFLGEPTGFTFRMGLSALQSVEAKAAWSIAANSSAFHVEANWLLEFPNSLVIEREQFTPYVGAGLALGIATGDFAFGIRVPAGIVYRFSEAPIELALEIALGMNVLPSTSLAPSGGLAIRYRF